MSPRAHANDQAKRRRVELLSQLMQGDDNNGTECNAEYMDADFVLGTNDEVERFFSKCKHVLTDCRASLTPLMFECITFLKVNDSYWGGRCCRQDGAEYTRTG
jgi:hypothetical protein